MEDIPNSDWEDLWELELIVLNYPLHLLKDVDVKNMQ
jgi:hypothetical protein